MDPNRETGQINICVHKRDREREREEREGGGEEVKGENIERASSTDIARNIH